MLFTHTTEARIDPIPILHTTQTIPPQNAKVKSISLRYQVLIRYGRWRL